MLVTRRELLRDNTFRLQHRKFFLHDECATGESTYPGRPFRRFANHYENFILLGRHRHLRLGIDFRILQENEKRDCDDLRSGCRDGTRLAKQ